MLLPSFSLSPAAPVFAARSLPAKSTRLNRLTFSPLVYKIKKAEHNQVELQHYLESDYFLFNSMRTNEPKTSLNSFFFLVCGVTLMEVLWSSAKNASTIWKCNMHHGHSRMPLWFSISDISAGSVLTAFLSSATCSHHCIPPDSMSWTN